MIATKIKISKATLAGTITVTGQKIRFEAEVDGDQISAEFIDNDKTVGKVDHWTCFKALEGFVEEHLQG